MKCKLSRALSRIFYFGMFFHYIIHAQDSEKQRNARKLSDKRTNACAFNSTIEGYSDVNSFMMDYTEGKSNLFLMCPDGSFDESLTLPSSSHQSMITITCADPDAICTWKIRNGSHIDLQNNDFVSLSVRGVSFQGATNTSIEINPSRAGRLFSFESCYWSENNGSAVINAAEESHLFDFSLPKINDDKKRIRTGDYTYVLGGIFSGFLTNPPDSPQLSDPEPSDESALASPTKIKLKRCSFHKNVVTQSIIFIDSTDIEIDGCDFVGNEVSDSLIHIKDEGLHDIHDVSFKDNKLLGEVPGIIFVSASSRFNSRGICGLNNQILQNEVCNGTAQQRPNTEECNALNDFGCTTECSPYNPCDECVSSTEELLKFLEDGGNLKLCENTVFDIDFLDEPLTIGEPAISLGCESNCTIKGGNQQLRIHDGATDVLIDGISFESSRDASIKVEIDHTEPADIHIRNCQFRGHSGSNIIRLLSSKEVLSTDEPIEAKIEIQNSILVDNAEQIYMIENKGLDLSIDSCKVWGNDNSGIVGAFGGTTIIRDCQSWGNNFTQGLFHVSGDSTTYKVERICSINDSFKGICNGTYYSSCVEDRTRTAECNGSCEPLVENNCSMPDCLSTYEELQIAMILSPGDTYVICPDTTINLDIGDEGFGITQPSTKIKCGENGLQEDNCVINGGSYHLIINTTDVGVYGMTFVDAHKTSIEIKANAEEPSSISFNDCSWEKNMGLTTFSIAAESADDSENSLAAVIISNSTFLMNNAEGSIISNGGSPLTISKSIFTQNSALNGSLIHIESNTTTISDVEFVKNVISEDIIFVSSDAELMERDICGFDNEAVNDSCDGIAEPVNGSLCKEDECELNCSSLIECLAPSLDLSENTSPTIPQGITIDAQSTIPSASKPICYGEYDWETFFTDVLDSMSDEVFTLCEGLSIDMEEMESKGLAPLIIKESGITIECAAPGTCLLYGGSSHIVLSGSIQDVAVTGLTLMDASESSIVGTLEKPSSAEFELCDWINNKGATVVSIVTEEGNRRMSSRNLEYENLLTWRSCNFEANTVSDAIIKGSESSIVLDTVIFERNTMKNVVSVNDGFLFLVDSCFIDSDTTAALINNESPDAVIENLFLSGNDNSECLGYLDDNGGCNSLTSASSCIAEKKRCISRWIDLAIAMRTISADDEEHIFTVCPNAVLDASNSGPIVINESKTVLRCGGNGASDGNCVVKGGAIQFKIEGSPKDVLFSGITFAEASVAAINAAGDRASQASVVDCIFRDIKGAHAALLIYGGEVPLIQRTGRRLSIEDFTEAYERSMTVEVSYSLFSSNEVNLAPIANLKGSLEVSSCKFNSNNGTTIAGGVMEWFSGSISVKKSCFTNNYGTLAGSIYANGDLAVETECFSEGNQNSDQRCNDGLFLAAASEYDGGPQGLCVDIVSSECGVEVAPTVSPTVAPTLPTRPTNTAPPSISSPIGCAKSWSALKSSIADGLTEGIHNTFFLCPHEVFLAGEDAIELNAKTEGTKITISCASESGDNCLIKGGRRHFHISGEDIRVAFTDITFEGSEEVSILAAADGASSLMFKGCEWTGNKGPSAILIYHEIVGDAYEVESDISSLPYPGKSMEAYFDSCYFTANKVTAGVIINIGGTLRIGSSSFQSNQDTEKGCVQCKGEDARVELRDSCFLDNHSIVPGTIHLIDGAKITVNEYNYGYNNKLPASLPTCSDIFLLPLGEGCDSTACSGTCSTFDAQRCSILGLDVEEDMQENSPSCHDDWADLRNAIVSSKGQKSSFTICDGAALEADDTAIVVSGNAVTIQCGEPEDTASASCVIKGGSSHFQLEGSVLLKGLTFEEAEFASIVATGPSSSIATFQECTWRKHSGEAIMVIHSVEEELTDLVASASSSPSSPGEAMTVLMEECLLENNEVTFAAIANFGGTLNLIKTTLHSNSGLVMILAVHEASVGLSETCLTQNSAENRIIFVDFFSTLTSNNSTFGAENQATASEGCDEIFLAGALSCTGLDDCEGDCEAFTSPTCSLSSTTNNNKDTKSNEAATEGMSVASLAGIIGGGVTGLLIFLGLAWYCLKKRKKRKNTKKEERLATIVTGSTEGMESSFQDDEISNLSFH